MGIKLTVYFEDPFWVGVFERVSGGVLETARVVFGPEPKDCEVLQLILHQFNTLRFGYPTTLESPSSGKLNPKRLQRKIRQEVQRSGIGTKAQQVLQMEYEARKAERQELSKRQGRLAAERQFKLRQQKKKERKKGH